MFKRKSHTELKAYDEGTNQYQLLMKCGLQLVENNRYEINTNEHKEFHEGFEIERIIQDPFNEA